MVPSKPEIQPRAIREFVTTYILYQVEGRQVRVTNDLLQPVIVKNNCHDRIYLMLHKSQAFVTLK